MISKQIQKYLVEKQLRKLQMYLEIQDMMSPLRNLLNLKVEHKL